MNCGNCKFYDATNKMCLCKGYCYCGSQYEPTYEYKIQHIEEFKDEDSTTM